MPAFKGQLLTAPAATLPPTETHPQDSTQHYYRGFQHGGYDTNSLQLHKNLRMNQGGRSSYYEVSGYTATKSTPAIHPEQHEHPKHPRIINTNWASQPNRHIEDHEFIPPRFRRPHTQFNEFRQKGLSPKIDDRRNPDFHPGPSSLDSKKREPSLPEASETSKNRTDKRYYCDVPECTHTMGFTRAHDVVQHKQCHASVKWTCEACGFDLSRKDGYNRHKRLNACGKWNRRVKQ